MNINMKKQFQKLKETIKQSRRVLKIATKPEKEEFWAVAKITLIGIGIIGAIAYIIRSIQSIFLI